MAKTKQPKISANKLGEYIQSNPHRRRTIVKEQKYPKKYVVTRYSGARKAIVDFFVHGKGDKLEIESKIKSLIFRNISSPFRRQDNDLSIKALQIFANSNLPNIGKYTTSSLNTDLNKLSIQGVQISVQPNVLIKGKIRGENFIGAIKIHISKTNPLKAESGKYVATLVHRHLEYFYNEKVRPDFCIAMDIFSGTYFTAPRSFKTLRKDIEAACHEIRLLWFDL